MMLFTINCQHPDLSEYLRIILDQGFDSSRNIYFNQDYQGSDKEDAEYLRLYRI